MKDAQRRDSAEDVKRGRSKRRRDEENASKINDAEERDSAENGNREQRKRRRDQDNTQRINDVDEESSADKANPGRTRQRQEQHIDGRMNEVERNHPSQNVDPRFSVAALQTQLGMLENVQSVLTILKMWVEEKLKNALENQGHVST